MNSLLKFLNPSEELRNNLDKFKEAFIEFYGEDSRDEVTEKFSKMLPIGFISPSHQKILLSSIEKKFTETMITKILENNSIEITKNDLFANYSFEFASLQPIYAYQKFYEVYSLSLEERKAKFYNRGYERITKYLKNITKEEFLRIIQNKQLPEKYNSLPQFIKEQFIYYFNERSFLRDYQKLYKNAEPLLKKIIPEADLSNIEEFKNDKRIKELKIILEEYQEALKMYDNFKNSLEEYYEKEEMVSNSEFELQTKYHKKLISKYKYLIPKNKQTNLEDYLAGIKESYTLDNYVKYFFGSSLYSETPLEFFSTNSEELLENGSKWRKKEITNQRIKYFNENGLNLGHDYQAYLECEEVKRIWPKSSDVDNFIVEKITF